MHAFFFTEESSIWFLLSLSLLWFIGSPRTVQLQGNEFTGGFSLLWCVFLSISVSLSLDFRIFTTHANPPMMPILGAIACFLHLRVPPDIPRCLRSTWYTKMSYMTCMIPVRKPQSNGSGALSQDRICLWIGFNYPFKSALCNYYAFCRDLTFQQISWQAVWLQLVAWYSWTNFGKPFITYESLLTSSWIVCRIVLRYTIWRQLSANKLRILKTISSCMVQTYHNSKIKLWKRSVEMHIRYLLKDVENITWANFTSHSMQGR